MPYYNGRWHRYGEAERQAFGERKRAELSKRWHAKWISKHGLKERLWTDKAILQFLGKPTLAGPVKAWLRKDVVAAERRPDFIAWMTNRREWLTARGKLHLPSNVIPLNSGIAKPRVIE
jgi:hypothetical protein